MPIPIPRRPSGYVMGGASAALEVEAFVDIQCPYSKKSWPTLLAVSDQHGPHDVQLRVQMLSMANQRQSWDVTTLSSSSTLPDSNNVLGPLLKP